MTTATTTKYCTTCEGTGTYRTPGADGRYHTCDHCDGKGKISTVEYPYTPGEWYYSASSPDANIFSEDHKPLAEVIFTGVDGRGAANMRLMALAPVMLAALQAVDRADSYMHERGAALRLVREAIDRAMGC